MCGSASPRALPWSATCSNRQSPTILRSLDSRRNLAARLQGVAAPGAVAIAAETRQLIGRLFECRDLGVHSFKGFDGPVQAWQVVGPGDIASQFDALRTSLPLVGRDQELATLLELWRQAKTGSGRVAVIRGEPGIGKSRVTLELLHRVDSEVPAIRRYDCVPQGKDSMLHPLLAHLQRAAMFERGDPPEVRVDKLGALLARPGRPAGEVIAILADLMALRAPGIAPPRLNGHRRRALLLEALVRGLEEVARHRPMLIVVEDIHWIDATSDELLARVVERVANLSVLVVVTSRPAARISWIGSPHVTVLDLAPIVNGDAVSLVEYVAGSEILARSIVDGIIARTDGVPLLIEEITKAVIESRSAANSQAEGRCVAPGEIAIPPSLHASLLARLDRLGHARQVASIAAALGREFSFDLLAAVAPAQSNEELRSGLEQLVNAELIVPIGPAPASSFRSGTPSFRTPPMRSRSVGSASTCTIALPRPCWNTSGTRRPCSLRSSPTTSARPGASSLPSTTGIRPGCGLPSVVPSPKA